MLYLRGSFRIAIEDTHIVNYRSVIEEIEAQSQ